MHFGLKRIVGTGMLVALLTGVAGAAPRANGAVDPPRPLLHFSNEVDAGTAAAVAPQGTEVVTLRPGELRTFIVRFTVSQSTADQIVFYSAPPPELPSFVEFNFNGGSISGLQVTLQYRLEVDSDAPGGSYPSRIIFEFRDFFGAILETHESSFTLVIDAPPPPDDHGNDCESATEVEINSQTAGSLAAGGDADYFRITVPETGTVTVFTTGSTDTVGTLLSDDCTPELTDDNSGSAANFSFSQLLDAGVYHVAVSHSNVLGSGDYTLNVEFSPLDPFVNFLYFPQFANGGGLTSQLKLLSLDPEAATNVLISIRGDDGAPLALGLASPAGAGGGEEIGVAVPAGGLAVLQTDGMGDPVSGSVTVRSDRPLAGVLVFGGQFGLAGVQDSPPIDQSLIAPVETGGAAQTNTGVALENLEESEITLRAELLDATGAVLATSSEFSLPGLGHQAIFVNQFAWDNPPDFGAGLQAVLRVVSGGGRFAATVLLVRPGQLASLPVVATSLP